MTCFSQLLYSHLCHPLSKYIFVNTRWKTKIFNRFSAYLVSVNLIWITQFFWYLYFNPLARREAPAEGRRCEGEGANIDRRLVTYHGKCKRNQSRIHIYIYIYIWWKAEAIHERAEQLGDNFRYCTLFVVAVDCRPSSKNVRLCTFQVERARELLSYHLQEIQRFSSLR